MTDPVLISRRAALGSAVALSATAALPAFAHTAAPDPAALANTLADEWLALEPERATSLGVDTGARAALKARSADPGPKGRAAMRAWLGRAIARIDAVGPAGDAAARQHLAVARSAFASASEGFRFGYGDVAVGGWRNGPYVVAQNMGSYLDRPKFLDGSHFIGSAADAEAYLARLAAWPAQLDAETADLKAARARRIVAPDFTLDKTLRQLRATRAVAPADTLVVQSLVRRAAAYGSDWGARAQRIVAGQVYPALDRQIAELEAHRRAATDRAGIDRLPQGAAFYAWALRASTTTTLPAAEIHKTGLAQVAELQAQMDTILRRLGLTQGPVGARMKALGSDPRYMFPAGDPGRAAILAFIDQRLADIRPRMPRAFRTLARGNVEVRRIAPAEEAGAPLAYGGAGSIDGRVPGKFWINLRDTAEHTRVSLPSLTYHEAIPGHVWQGEYTQRLPLLRALVGGGFNAFSEGWGLYAEQLGDELGAYEGDDAGRLGYLNSMVFRAVRLVVDTGIHSQGWSRARAIQYFAETTGDPAGSIESEVDRYCVWPGQACGYKIGHNEINRQRRRAQAALGPKFDMQAYNELVITGGSRPLSILEKDVSAMIARG